MFRQLRADEIDLRVGTCNKKGFSLLLYKDARCDMNILDETVGTMNWKKSYQLIDGQLFCTIEIWDDEKKQWIGKQDVGIESNTEAEKGRASDAQKRAATVFGIGRELYTAPFIWIKGHTTEVDNRRFKTDGYDRALYVDQIDYTEGKITTLVIKDDDGRIAYSFGKDAPKQRLTKVQLETIKGLAEEVGVDIRAINKTYGISKLEDLDGAMYADCIRRFQIEREKHESAN